MRMTGMSCIFPVPDIRATAQYYATKLGFRAVEYLACKERHICLYRDDVEIILLQANAPVTPNRILYGYGYDAYVYTENQEELERAFEEKEVRFIKRLNITDYQNREFVIEDIDGRWLAFGLKIK